MLKVVTYLLPLSGEMLLKKLHGRNRIEIVAAFVPRNYYSDCRGQINWLENNQIPYRVPETLDDPDLRDWVSQFDLDFGLSVGYDKRLPEWLYDYPEGGTVNFHPSLLPAYRGANPYFWTIKNQEDTTGATLHYMDDGLDTGAVIEQHDVPVEDGETMGTLFFKLNNLGVEMFDSMLDKILETGETPDGREQKKKNAAPRKAPRVQERHLRIEWDTTIEEIQAHVRAANPFLGAFTTFKGTKVRVYETDSAETPDSARKDDAPGRIHPTDQGPVVRCANGWLRLEVVQFGQNYKASGRTFQKREKSAFDVLKKVI